MSLRNWVTSFVGKPLVDVSHSTIKAISYDPYREFRSPIETAPTVRDVNFGTQSTGIRVGDVHFCYYPTTNDFHTLRLYYSPEVMLTPGYVNACALYQAIKLGIIERHSEMVWGDFERRAQQVGADWSYLRVLHYEDKRKLWICRGDLTLHADSARLTKLFSDLKAAVQEAGFDPELYFALPH